MSDQTPRGFEPTVRIDLTDVNRYWERCLRLSEDVARFEDGRPDEAGHDLTDRRFDESQPAGHRVYFGAFSQIQAGAEHIDALVALLHHHGATPRAPWTLLRSVFEAGFWTCWLLEPDDGVTRRQRGLMLEVRSMRERTAFYDAFLRNHPDARDEKAAAHLADEQVYRREAETLGVPWSRTKDRLNVVRELEQLAVVRALEPDLQAATVAVWRSLSGMQHGLAYALVVNSDREHEHDIDGGVRARFTIGDDQFKVAAMAASLMLFEGAALFMRRSQRRSV